MSGVLIRKNKIRRLRAKLCLTLFGVVGVWTSLLGGALGQDASLVVALRYEVPGTCPSSDAFVTEFHRRAPGIPLVEGLAAQGTVLVIGVADEIGRSLGHLEIRGGQGPSLTRDVTGQSCSEVISALALVAALAIAPQQSSNPAEAGRIKGSGELGAESDKHGASPWPSAEVIPRPPPSLSRPEQASAVEPEVDRVSPAAAPHSPAGSSHHWALGLEASALVGVLPEPSPALGLFAQATKASTAWVTPSYRLSLAGAISGAVHADRGREIGTTSFQWLATGLDGCARVRLDSKAEAYPCMSVQVGVLSARGWAVEEPHDGLRAWFTLGGVAHLRWLATSSIFLELSGAVRMPVVREAFVILIPDRVEVHKIPTTVQELGIAAGLNL